MALEESKAFLKQTDENGVSVYSGQDAFFEVSGLSAKRCYVFRVAAYVEGVWTKFSDALRVSSSKPMTQGASLLTPAGLLQS